MTTKRITMAAAAALLITAFGTAAAFAQGSQPQMPQAPQPPAQQAPMAHHGMMGRMSPDQMSRMAEGCHRMTEMMRHAPAAPQGAQPGNG